MRPCLIYSVLNEYVLLLFVTSFNRTPITESRLDLEQYKYFAALHPTPNHNPDFEPIQTYHGWPADRLPSYMSIVNPIAARPTAIGPMHQPIPWLRPGEFQRIRVSVRAFEDAQIVASPPPSVLNPNAQIFEPLAGTTDLPTTSVSDFPVGGGVGDVEIGFDMGMLDDDGRGADGFMDELLELGSMMSQL
ncbi:hypothetical protein HK104_003640 [Borealophlyctis nickersoniae]|nr:hypothetical protein HK104_003640 [Borealophlyctis nickersoniae]